MTRETIITVIRWIAGVSLLWAAWHYATSAYYPLNLPLLLLGGLALVAGVAALWSTIFQLATRPFLLLIDLVYSPGGRLERPVLNLKLPAHYLNEGRHDEALSEYRKILRYYPDEVEAYEKAIWLEAEVFHRPREAAKLLRRAERRSLNLDERIVRLGRVRRE